MTSREAIALLRQFRDGEVGEDRVLRAFQAPPSIDLGVANVDHHRALRKGYPEVIFCEGKTPDQVCTIAKEIYAQSGRVLMTRLKPSHEEVLGQHFPTAIIDSHARCALVQKSELPQLPGYIAVVCAGTSDLPVAEEAAFTAQAMGNRIKKISDVGVAGIHRLLDRIPDLQDASIVIAVAGMEGALPSAISGLTASPVIAVPTSVGYGANFGGVAALLGMLNSCGSGVTVVNIDNGFGAGYAASQINHLIANGPSKAS